MSAGAYRTLALQTRCQAINGCSSVQQARAKIAANIERVGQQIAASRQFIGSDLALVVLPEYFATGYPLGDRIEAWAEKAGFALDGAEYATLGAIAQRNQLYLAVNAYELDPHFPGLYFQACVLLAPDGSVALRYRRLISLYAPSPYDVWDAYLDRYGLDGVFPVADTTCGRLACVASEEILYPEIARAMALRGAEVLLHSTSEIGSPQATPKSIAKRARAFENMCFVVSANSAGIADTAFPEASTDGMSTVICDQGRELVLAGFGESMVAHAEIDIAALRRRRQRAGMGHTLSRLPQAAISAGLAVAPLAPNALLDGDRVRIPERAEFAQRQLRVIAGMLEAGVLSRG